MRFTTLGCAIAAAALVTFPAGAQDRFSMTGTYEGVLACDDVTAGSPGGFSTPALFKIVQRGSSDVALELNYGDPEDPTVCLYEGAIELSPGGEVVSGFYEACGGTFESKELARISPADAIEDGFSFAADSIFQSTDTTPDGALVVQGCKFVFVRVDGDRPDIQTCD